jgi:hypothetical protein
MAIASAAIRSTDMTSAQAIVEIIASSTNAYRCLEVGVSVVNATAGVVGFGQPNAIGNTPGTSAAFVFEDGGNSSTPGTKTALSWTTSPTAPTVQQRRVSFTNVVGSGIIWTFPRGYNILLNKTLTVNNITGGPLYDVWVVIDE